MKLFKKHQYSDPLRTRIGKMAETAIKCFILLLVPGLIASSVSAAWYILLYRHDRNFGDGMQDIIATALLPALGIVYGIIVATIAVQTVWTEYKSMRTAVKRYDLDTFMDLRDEELSPLIHLIAGTMSLGMLSGFLALRYPTAWAGGIIIFSVTFFLSLMYVVIIEIDDPCSGLWYIKNIPEEWLALDPKKYRDERRQRIRDAEEHSATHDQPLLVHAG